MAVDPDVASESIARFGKGYSRGQGDEACQISTVPCLLQWLNLQFACVFPFVATSTMPDIAKSDISPNLDRDKMFNELWWLNYCFCEGVGIGAVGNPFFGGEAVNICLHSKCASADW